MQRVITFKMDEQMLQVLDHYARENRLSRSEVIREAIKLYLEMKGVDSKLVNYNEYSGRGEEDIEVMVEKRYEGRVIIIDI